MTDGSDGAKPGEGGVHRLRLGRDLSEVMRMNAWLDEVAAALGMGAGLAHDVRLCLNEALTNTLSYGFEGREGGMAEVEIAAEGGGLRVRLADDGTPFDPLARPEAAPAEDIASAAIGGLGIKLIRQTAQRVHYARENGRNVLTLYFEAPDAPLAPGSPPGPDAPR